MSEVASPEPPRLCYQPVHPFEPETLNPLGRTRHETREKIERSADADGDRYSKLFQVVVDPQLLLRATEANEKHVRICFLNFSTDSVIHLIRKWIGGDRWRVVTTDANARKTALQHRLGSLERLVGSTEEIEFDTDLGRKACRHFYYVWTGDALAFFEAEAPSKPDERHAVGHGQVGLVNDFPELRKGPGKREEVDVDSNYLSWPSALYEIAYDLTSRSPVDALDDRVENSKAFKDLRNGTPCPGARPS